MVEVKQKKGIFSKVCIGILIVAILAGGAFGAFLFLNKSDYKDVEPYSENTKKVGDMKHERKIEEDKYHLSFYYPEFKNKTLDQIVKAYGKENFIPLKEQKAMYFMNIDYATTEVYKSYITLTFTRTIRDENKKIIRTDVKHYNYDKNTDEIMDVRNVLRRDYISALQELAGSAGIDKKQILTKNLNDFLVQEKKVTFFIDGKTLDVPYLANKENIALTNPNIPSLYQKEAIVPKKRTIDPNKKMVAVTFDDGPHGKNTEIIMNEFEKYNGLATFFMLGQNASVYPNIIKDMYQRGFELGNHSWDHSMRIAANRTNFMNKAEVAQELYKTQDAIFKACGNDAQYFRPPYGAINKNVREVSTMDFALWDIDTLDWQSHNPDTITNIISSQVKDGSIILIHDIHDTSMEAVKKFLPVLDEQGYQLVTMQELMKYRGDNVRDEQIVIQATNNK